MTSEGIWLSITEYTEYRGVSISTIRRYIKANQVKYKLEDGKYWILVQEENFNRQKNKNDSDILKLKLCIKELEIKNKKLQEENDELIMLVGLYEDKKPFSVTDECEQI